MEEVYHCAARPRRHFHMLAPMGARLPELHGPGPKRHSPAWCDRAVTPRGIGLMARKCSGVNWPMHKNCQLNASWPFFFSHSRLHIVTIQHAHMGITAASARLLDQRAPLCPALRAGMTRNKYTQRTRNPLGGGFYTAQARALAAQPPRLCLPLAQQHVGIIKNYACGAPTSRCLPRPRWAVLADENTRP